MPRFAAIPGVTAEVSPHVGYPDSPFHPFEPLVGQERLDRMFPAGSLVRAGARPGYGSDWLTVLEPNPWPTMETFVTRMHPDQPKLGELGKNETVTVEEAIRMFTINGAYTVMAEDHIGSIETGKQADMIVLDRNLLETDPMELDATKVLATVLGGQVVYDATRDKVVDVIDESDYPNRVVH
jgi:hypothetical protein